MPTPVKLLITDLDNTLYDWVTYFSAAFYSMLEELSNKLNIDAEVLIKDFKQVHSYYEDTEQPFAVTEVSSIIKRFPGKTPREIITEVDSALYAFNKKRKETLKLYDGVAETLAELRKRGIILIAHTESTVHNALFRLKKLEIKEYIKNLYALEGKYKPHPIKEKDINPPDDGFVIIVPKIDRKPNPRLLKDICKNEGVLLSEVAYIGDSLTRDISMAKEAGVFSIWAKYGKSYSEESWNKLVRITHWSKQDVDREASLRERYSNIKPDYTVNSFREILDILS